MLKTELYCVTKNFYPLIFILGERSYSKYVHRPASLADDMIIDPKRRVFILEEEDYDSGDETLVEENLLDIGLKHSFRQLDLEDIKESKKYRSVPLKNDSLRESQLKASVLTQSTKFYLKNASKLRESHMIKGQTIGRNDSYSNAATLRKQIEEMESSGQLSPQSTHRLNMIKNSSNFSPDILKVKKMFKEEIDEQKELKLLKRKKTDSFDLDRDNTTESSEIYSDYKIDLDEDGNDLNMPNQGFVY